MNVCMYVCIYVCMYACMYVCINVYMLHSFRQGLTLRLIPSRKRNSSAKPNPLPNLKPNLKSEPNPKPNAKRLVVCRGRLNYTLAVDSLNFKWTIIITIKT